MPIEREAVEVEELESWFDAECSCMHGHRDQRNQKCTVEATHAITTCVLSATPSCEAAATFIRDAITGVYGMVRCGDCGQSCESHWRAVPI